MKNKTIIALLSALTLSGCSGFPILKITNSSSTTNSSTKIEESSKVTTSSKEDNKTSSSTKEDNKTSSSSKKEEGVLKTLTITPANFDSISELDLNGVVENTDHTDEFTFNSNAVMKSNKIKGIEEITIHVYQTYENLSVYSNYNGTGSALKASKETLDKAAKFTYTLNGADEFYIVNSSDQYRTHVYSIEISYTGAEVSGGNSGNDDNGGNVNTSGSWSEDELEMFTSYLFTDNIPYISGGEWIYDYYEYYGALEYYIESGSESALTSYESALEDAGYEYYYTDEYDTNYYVGETDYEEFYLLVNPYLSESNELVIDFYVQGTIFEVESWDDLVYYVDEYVGATSNLPEPSVSEYYFMYDATYGGSIDVIIPCSDPESFIDSYAGNFDSSYVVDEEYSVSGESWVLYNEDTGVAVEMYINNFEDYENYDSIILYIYSMY